MSRDSGPPPDYNEVADRVVEFRTKHPEGSLQQRSLQFLDFAGKSWVVYTAAAYRAPDDPRPGEGTAWEPVPGPTAFTRDSEVQNAETSAWGRAIVAALAADAKRIATAEDVRSRQAAETPSDGPSEAQVRAAHAKYKALDGDAQRAFLAWSEQKGYGRPESLTKAQMRESLDKLTELGS